MLNNPQLEVKSQVQKGDQFASVNGSILTEDHNQTIKNSSKSPEKEHAEFIVDDKL